MNELGQCAICAMPIPIKSDYVIVLRSSNGRIHGIVNYCHAECFDRTREAAWRKAKVEA